MAGVQESVIEQVKAEADIVAVIGEHVQLRKAGSRYLGLCPFHAEKTPSFSVNPDRGLFYCFGCHEHGDVLSFMMRYHNMNFPDALAALAARCGIDLEDRELTPEERRRQEEREQLFRINEAAAAIFHNFLLHDAGAAEARRYLAKRKISAEIIERFQLGYAPERWDFLVQALSGKRFGEEKAVTAGLLVRKDGGGVYDRFRDRVIFPIMNGSGRVCAFGGRILGDGRPKYLNSPESPVFSKSDNLYGLFQNRDAIRRAGVCLVVEGNFDLLALVAHGVNHVAAPLGTALTAQHVKIVKRWCREAVLLFDGDQAGIKAALRAAPLFLAERLDARVVVLPPEQDPDSYVRECGRQELEQRVREAQELPEFVFDRLVQEHGLTLTGKNRILAELQPLLAASAGDRARQKLVAAHFAERLGLPADALLDGYPKSAPVRQPVVAPPAAARQPRLSDNCRRLLEFLLLYPDSLEALRDAGLQEYLAGEKGSARTIVDAMTRIASPNSEQFAVESLLEILPAEESDLVARILVALPVLDAEKDALLSDWVSWLRRQATHIRRAGLRQDLDAAMRDGDEVLQMELLQKIKNMDEETYP